MNKILLVGCGHMGSALLKAWYIKTSYLFTVVDPLKYKKIDKVFNNRVISVKSLSEVKNYISFDIIVFAIKPQMADKILGDLIKQKFSKDTIFVSIIAGKKINFFNKFLPNPNQFIRVMPNMPILINLGMSCLFANKNTSRKNKKIINSLFSSNGKTLWLKNEIEINKVTAISGSGPGYIFFMIDAFEKAAFELGLSKQVTKKLVHQTVLGSIHLLLSDNKNADVLASNIAIKGGTTEAGLNHFKNKKLLHKMFQKAVKAAFIRANFLGK